jgi:hypothetical protein
LDDMAKLELLLLLPLKNKFPPVLAGGRCKDEDDRDDRMVAIVFLELAVVLVVVASGSSSKVILRPLLLYSLWLSPTKSLSTELDRDNVMTEYARQQTREFSSD